MDEAWIHSILSGQARGVWPFFLRGTTRALESVYTAVIRRRNASYDQQPATRLARPTISIGNLTTGGTGKTPMVAWVAHQLMVQGHRPCVLMRGYRGNQGRSDEAEELKKLGIPWVRPNPDRIREASRALQEDPTISCFILDDGFQHRRIARDLDLVLVDASCPFGYNHLLPRGLLREPPESLRRASAVIITRCDRSADLTELTVEITRLAGQPPIAACRHAWDGFLTGPPQHERRIPSGNLSSRRVVATCGIGNPLAFMAQAREMGADILVEDIRPDHHAWTAEECRRLLKCADEHRADALLLTEKDFVKWIPHLDHLPSTPPIWRPCLSLSFASGGTELAKLLQLPLNHTP